MSPLVRRALIALVAVLALAAFGLGAIWSVKVGWQRRPDPARFPVRGIDVSHHQGEIDWAAVRAEGWRFAWLKATEGGDWTDTRFAENRAGAEAVGLPWGAYHFYTFCRAPEEQAAHFLATTGAGGALPPAVDVETGGNCSRRLEPSALRADVARFSELVTAATGRPVLAYVVERQAERLFGPEGPPNQHLWVRNIHTEPSPIGGQPCTIWQHHARGWVAGIKGFTDMNVYCGDEVSFEAWLRRG